ncbi:hypothetical protein KSW81_006186 [Nannochloris sp. 'desiccata']|nr:hypothetical protein KSW81_006186 [Chlorella desiccata (nom. nud.)]
MPNPKAIVKASAFNPALLNFDAAGRYPKGGKFVSVSYGPEKQRVYMQTINLSCPFGLSTYVDPKTGQKSYSIDVAFKDLGDPHTKGFHDTMLALNHVTLNKAVELSKDWFGKEVPMEMIREFYRPLIRQPKDPRYSPTMKIKIPVDKSGVPTAEIYNEAKERVSIDSIAKGSSITCIIELSPVWFVNKTFGLTWKLVQAAVTPGPQNFAGYSLLEEEEDW